MEIFYIKEFLKNGNIKIHEKFFLSYDEAKEHLTSNIDQKSVKLFEKKYEIGSLFKYDDNDGFPPCYKKANLVIYANEKNNRFRVYDWYGVIKETHSLQNMISFIETTGGTDK